MKRIVVPLLILFAAITIAGCSRSSQEAGPSAEVESAVDERLLGRWNVTVEYPNGTYPSWFEISADSGEPTGRFVGRFGSARPIESLRIGNGALEFSLPPQYEEQEVDLRFAGRLAGSTLEGTTNAEDGSNLEWTAVRAPELRPVGEPRWGQPIELFNGRNLQNWRVRFPNEENTWTARDGLLINREKGVDLMTVQKFDDFSLHLEFQYPAKSNSGVYLRGRYEVQIQDDFGREPGNLYMGGVYGFLAPTSNEAKQAGQWQNYDITLLGRYVTIVLNGVTVVDNQEIPGITGGALDSNEGMPGPILLQGDHGPVTFRNIVLRPAIWDTPTD
jgi:hypothetical protein